MKKKTKSSGTVSMSVINAHAAGIDVGSREHYVAIGQQPQDVSKFGVYSKDNAKLVLFLQQQEIATVAMESTGTYWQPLFACIQAAGIEVVLSNNYIKDPEKKTDAKDARWLQRLHTLGLLKTSFIPAVQIEQVRTYHRHRSSLVAQAATCTQKMQKALRLMNIRLDIALNDITGVSGMAILQAIVAGQRDGKALASLVDNRVRKSKDEIADALQGQWKAEQLYILKDELESYQHYQSRMVNCDKQIEALLEQITVGIAATRKAETPATENISPVAAVKKTTGKNRKQKNGAAYNVSKLSMEYFGVDLLEVEGIGEATVMTFIAEVGSDIIKFPSKKNFTSWLRLSPNNKITGGKVFSSRTPKGKNILSNAFRLAANTIAQRKDGVLKKIFSRIAFKKGRAAAITALARRLAEIFWIMTVKKVPYKAQNEKEYEEKTKNNVIKNIQHKMRRLNLTTEDIGMKALVVR
jgi:transposase